MSDARAFTDYATSCTLNKSLQKQFNMKDEHQYRYFLQNNANTLMLEFNKAANKNCKICPNCEKDMESNKEAK